jgi:hypothetical protein
MVMDYQYDSSDGGISIIKLQEKHHVNTVIFNHIMFLEQEVSILESRVMPEDTGHIITAINVIKNRIEELKRDNITDYK